VATNLYLKDEESRFGTFVQFPEGGVSVKDYNPLPVTIERKCFFLTHRPRFSIWSKCIYNSCLRGFPTADKVELEDHLDEVWHSLPEAFLHQIYPEFAALYSKYMEDRKHETRIIRSI